MKKGTEEYREYHRKFLRNRADRWRDSGRCVICGHPRDNLGFKTCDACRDRVKKYGKTYRARTFDKVLEVYGRCCACCGEDNPKFLTVDHVNNDGNAQRKLYGGGQLFYKKLEKLGWPSGLQILCFNCNCAKSRNGGVCPHRTELRKAVGEF